MSPDLFPKFLKNSDALHRISYEELKTLVVEYPYCQNLRYLLYQKSKLEGHGDTQRHLEMLAAYTFDRKILFDKNHLERDSNNKETVLELPELKKESGTLLEDSNLELPDLEETPDHSLLDTTTGIGALVGGGVIAPNLKDSSESDKTPEEEIDQSIQSALEKLKAEQEKNLEELEGSVPQAEQLTPMPKASFSSWLKQMKSPKPTSKDESSEDNTKSNTPIKPESTRLLKIMAAKKMQGQSKKGKPKKKKKVLELAEKSLAENEEIVSETLAQILSAQGKHSKAIKMYEQLSLKFPKKSAYFAVQIDNIKKKRKKS